MSFSQFSSSQAIKAACVVISAALTACAPLPEPEPPEPAPFVSAERSAPRGTLTKQIEFRASEMTSGPHRPVTAACSVKGERFRARFHTPATLAIPVVNDGWDVDMISCKFGEEVAEWTNFPTAKSSWALVLFRGAAEAGKKSAKSKSQVIYGDQYVNSVTFPVTN